MRTRGFLAALALPLVLATGCGGEATTTATDPTPSSAGSPEGTPDAGKAPGPQCVEVWQDRAQLPRSYDGCYEDATLVKADGRYCEFGKPLVTYADRFYAVRGGLIREAHRPFADDPTYQDVLAKCTA